MDFANMISLFHHMDFTNMVSVLMKKQNLQLVRATYDFLVKNNVSIGEGEYADEIFS